MCSCNEGVTGHMLYSIMWEAVRRLEEINLKVSSHTYICVLNGYGIYTYLRQFNSITDNFVILKHDTIFAGNPFCL